MGFNIVIRVSYKGDINNLSKAIKQMIESNTGAGAQFLVYDQRTKMIKQKNNTEEIYRKLK
jgi:hypothetical protein